VTIEPTTGDFVYVPVPKARVLEVMRLLGSAPSETQEHGGMEVSPSVETPDETPEPGRGATDSWRAEELHALVQECPAKQLLVLQYLAQAAPATVTAWQLREYLVEHHDISGISTERSGRALGAVMAALGKRSAWWDREMPFKSRWDEKRWENVYCMPESNAGPILDAMREHRREQMGATS